MREKVFADLQTALAHAKHLPLAPQPSATKLAEPHQDLLAQFKESFPKLGGTTFVQTHDGTAWLLNFLRERNLTRVVMWDEKFLPLPQVSQALTHAGVQIVSADLTGVERAAQLHEAAQADVGLTGVTAACAAVGSLVLEHGAGRGRLVSLIAPIHIAFFTRAQLVPSLESWLTQFNPNLSNTLVLSGPSRTSDIERVLVLGAHGPKEVFAVYIE